jgi:hypothetical protein
LVLFAISDSYDLTGPIPEFNATSLWFLQIAETAVTSMPSSIGKLTNLGFLQIAYNSITGSIPDVFSQNATVLTYVDFTDNQLTGTVPGSLITLPALEYILVGSNALSGSLPDFSGLGTSLTVDLSDNKFSGSIGSSFNGTTFPRLTLRSNELSGDIPDYLWSSATVLDLGINSFSGSLPATWNFDGTSLDISYNQFNGSIPTINGPALQTLILDGKCYATNNRGSTECNIRGLWLQN